MWRILNWWNTKRGHAAMRRAEELVSRQLGQLEEQVGNLERQLADCEERLEAEQVRCRILQIEVDLLAGVHARDLKRWQQEQVTEPQAT